MSAWLVSQKHIAYLLHAAEACPHINFSWWWEAPGRPGRHVDLEPADGKKMNAVGQMLWDENLASLRHRYPDHAEHDVHPLFAYSRVGLPAIEWVQVLKACKCYAYQACEHDGWKHSQARAFVEALKGRAIDELPGYGDAAWGID